MRWFGTAWNTQGICALQASEPTPLGAVCALCRRAITAGDNGLLIPHLGETDTAWHERVWHLSCFRDLI